MASARPGFYGSVSFPCDCFWQDHGGNVGTGERIWKWEERDLSDSSQWMRRESTWGREACRRRCWQSPEDSSVWRLELRGVFPTWISRVFSGHRGCCWSKKTDKSPRGGVGGQRIIVFDFWRKTTRASVSTGWGWVSSRHWGRDLPAQTAGSGVQDGQCREWDHLGWTW